MATTIISKLNRKFVVSAATRRYGSPHRLKNGRIGIALETETNVGKLRKVSSETNLLGSNIDNNFYHQQRSFGTRYVINNVDDPIVQKRHNSEV